MDTTAILDLPALRESVFPLRVESYHRLIDSGDLEGRRVELLRGLIISKMAKSTVHTRVTLAIHQRLSTEFSAQNWLVRKEDPLTFSDSELEPDLSIVRGSLDDFIEDHPSTAEVVIEVAVTSYARDLAKTEVYAEAKIPEVWIIEPEKRAIEVFRLPEGSEYQERIRYDATAVICPLAKPEFSFRLQEYLPPES